MKNTFAKKFTVCVFVGVFGFALMACDDSSSGNNDSSDTAEPSSNGGASHEPSGIDYGSFSDGRDGQVYKTVIIGERTWMAENLAIESGSTRCVKYGCLYTWETARDACPEGWALPTDDDYKTLIELAGGEKKAGYVLKSKSGWNGTGNGSDGLGFSAFPAGFVNVDGDFENEGNFAYFWSATEYVGHTEASSTTYAYALHVMSSDKAYLFNVLRGSAFSIRCVKG